MKKNIRMLKTLVFTQLQRYEHYVTEGQFLSGVHLVGIQKCPLLIAEPRLKEPVGLPAYT